MKKKDDQRMRYGYNGKAAMALGIVQLVLGTGSLVTGIICIFQLTSFGYIGHGAWCGTMFIVAGAVVISAGIYSKDSLVIAATALSAVAMLFSVGQTGISSVGLYYDLSQDYCYDEYGQKICNKAPFEYCSSWVSGPQCLDENGRNVSVILAGILSVFALIEFAIALSSACLICSCCSVRDNKVDDMTQTVPVQPMVIRVPPSSGTPSNIYDFEDTKSHRAVTSRTEVPPEWRLSYAN